MTAEDLIAETVSDPPIGEDPSHGNDTRASLRARARSAVVWNTGFNLFRDLTQFATMLMLVRLLKPASYGEFGLTTSIVGFFSIFGFGLFVSHALQVQHESETRYQEHFTAGGVLNVSLFVLLNGCAAVLWFVPKYAAVAPYVHAMSVTFLLEWPCELRRKMLERALDWKRLRLLHATGIAASALVAVVMAWSGFGTWALLLPGLLVTLPFIFDLFVRERWRPTWRWHWKDYQEPFRFGMTRLGSGVAVTGKTLLEASVLSVMFGFTGLGIYNRAIGLSVIFCSKFASQFVYAVYPILTRVEQQGGSPVRTGNLVLRVIAWSAIPTGSVLAIFAGPFVRFLYGKGWEGVVPILPWAMPVTVLAALIATGNSLLLARQQAGRCLAVDIMTLGVTAVALATMPGRGAEAYLAVTALLLGTEFVVVTYWLLRFGAADVRGIATAVLPPVAIAGLASLVVTGFVAASGPWSANSSVMVPVALAVFGSVYLIGLRLLFKEPFAALLSLFPRPQLLKKAFALR